MEKIAFVFPGQGAQMVGMGLDLYRNSAIAREVFEKTDQALNFPLSRLCFEGPEEELRKTINAQPAIMAVSIACLKAFPELWQRLQPSFVAGHSLGEYTALVAADAVEFTDAIYLVRERGRLMQEAGLMQPGGMAAIMGVDEFAMMDVCQRFGIDIANINSPNQLVISGEVEALKQAMDWAQSQGARVVPLDVSGAFHSQLMEPAMGEIAQIVSQIELRDPKIPIVANTNVRTMTTATAIKEELPRQVRHCVHWLYSVQYMVRRGVSTFVEIGPGKVLSGLIKKTDKRVQTINISDISSIEALTA